MRRRGNEVTSVLSHISLLNERFVPEIYEHGFVTVMCDDKACFQDEGIETTTPGEMRD